MTLFKSISLLVSYTIHWKEKRGKRKNVKILRKGKNNESKEIISYYQAQQQQSLSPKIFEVSCGCLID